MRICEILQGKDKEIIREFVADINCKEGKVFRKVLKLREIEFVIICVICGENKQTANSQIY